MLPETFRAPTPLIAFQHVLIPGVFLIGFLLSPLLVVSRHLASKPSYRLRVCLTHSLLGVNSHA